MCFFRISFMKISAIKNLERLPSIIWSVSHIIKLKVILIQSEFQSVHKQTVVTADSWKLIDFSKSKLTCSVKPFFNVLIANISVQNLWFNSFTQNFFNETLTCIYTTIRRKEKIFLYYMFYWYKFNNRKSYLDWKFLRSSNSHIAKTVFL